MRGGVWGWLPPVRTSERTLLYRVCRAAGAEEALALARPSSHADSHLGAPRDQQQTRVGATPRPLGNNIPSNQHVINGPSAAWLSLRGVALSPRCVSDTLRTHIRFLYLLVMQPIALKVPVSVKGKFVGFEMASGSKLIVIEDPSVRFAAVAMSVAVGSYDDPDSLSGLAHFCEHMLFCGSVDFPCEDEYVNFVQQHRGSYNAYTTSHQTTFFAKIPNEFLDGLLQRFLPFFVAPSLESGCSSREVMAVDSEDKRNREVDAWRLNDVLRDVANKKHPFSRYGCGNKDTLMSGGESAKLCQALRQFYRTQYFADRMALAVCSPLPVSEILARVTPYLDNIPRGPGTAKKCFTYVSAEETVMNCGHWINFRSLKAGQKLNMIFEVACPANDWKKSPSSYISHILGHECDTSVLGVLQRRGLATDMVVGSSYFDDDRELLNITTTLTLDGLRSLNEVVQLFFYGIGLSIKDGVNMDVYNEMIAQSKLQFESSDVHSLTDLCASLSQGALSYDLPHSFAPHYPLEDDFDATLHYVQQLVPSRCLFVLCWGDLPLPEAEDVKAEHESLLASLPDFAQSKASDTSHHTGARFSTKAIPKNVLDHWKSCIDGPFPDGLRLPGANPFVATDLTVFPPSKKPSAIERIQGPHGVTYVRKDDGHHNSFTAAAECYLLSGIPYSSPLQRFYFRVMIKILEDGTREFRYDGCLASLWNAVEQKALGIVLKVEGPQQHLSTFFIALLQASLRRSVLEGSEEAYGNYSRHVKAQLENLRCRPVYHIALDKCRGAFTSCLLTPDEVLEGAVNASYDGYLGFVDEYLSGGFLYEFFAVGNIKSAEDVRQSFVDRMEDCLKDFPIPPSESLQPVFDSYQVSPKPARSPPRPGGTLLTSLTALYYPALQDDNRNTCAVLWLNAGPRTPRNSVLMKCANALLSAPFFNALRTHETLGYVVLTTAQNYLQSSNIAFLVESSIDSVDGIYLLSRITAFLCGFEEVLESVCSDAAVASTLKAVITELEQPPISIANDLQLLRALYMDPSGFRSRELEVEEAKRLTGEDVRSFLRRKVCNHRDCTGLAVVVDRWRKEKAPPAVWLPGQRFVDLPPFHKVHMESEEAPVGAATDVVLPHFDTDEKYVMDLDVKSSVEELHSEWTPLRHTTLFRDRSLAFDNIINEHPCSYKAKSSCVGTSGKLRQSLSYPYLSFAASLVVVFSSLNTFIIIIMIIIINLTFLDKGEVDIVLHKEYCYLVPRVRCVPPLQWIKEEQKFVPVRSNDDVDRILAFLNARPGGGAAQPVGEWAGFRVLACEALYGALHLGGNTRVLVFVAASEKVGAFTISKEQHDIYRARKMKWVRLPRPDASKCSEDGEEIKVQESTSFYANEAAVWEEFSDGSHPHGSVSKEYLSILNTFCRSCETDASFFYCSTLNLAFHPEDILALCSASVHRFDVNTLERLRERCASIVAFQWNHMLLQHFTFPSVNEICCKGCDREVCCPQKSLGTMRQIMFLEQEPSEGSGSDHVLPRTPRGLAPCGTLYLPSFIRGFFGSSCNGSTTTYVVTRVCCQWAGTRFNRRGLEPGSSGVCANMAVSTLWCVSNPQAGAPRRVAVVDLLRGSIPRRWEQRANLAIKPPIRLLSHAFKTTPLEELTCHVQLVKHLLPHLQYLLCVDATAHGREEVLGAAYKDAVEKYREQRAQSEGMQKALPVVGYMHSCVGSMVIKKLKRFDAVTDALIKEEDIVFHSEPTAVDRVRFTTWSEQRQCGTDDVEVQNAASPPHQTFYYRINCVDCIDRTTIVQCCVTNNLLPDMLRSVLGETERISAAEQRLTSHNVLSLLREQGHSISMLYSGTGHHLSYYPVRGYVWLPEVAKIFFVMIARWYQQNFFDGRKQDAVSLVTLQHNCAEQSVDSTLAHDFSKINRDFFYGIVCAGLPLTYSMLALFLAVHFEKQRNVYESATSFIREVNPCHTILFPLTASPAPCRFAWLYSAVMHHTFCQPPQKNPPAEVSIRPMRWFSDGELAIASGWDGSAPPPPCGKEATSYPVIRIVCPLILSSPSPDSGSDNLQVPTKDFFFALLSVYSSSSFLPLSLVVHFRPAVGCFPLTEKTEKRNKSRAMSRDVLRRAVERFWLPFMAGTTGEDLHKYRFRENLNTIRTPDNDFTCQVNGCVGGAALLEDFFFVLLSGFDIQNVTFAWRSSLYDPCLTNYCGSYTLVHARPFLGWKPAVVASHPLVPPHTLSNLDNSTVVSNTFRNTSRRRREEAPAVIQVPFSMHVEGGGSHELLSHIAFRSPALRHVVKEEECPEDVRQCLRNPKAVQMIASLRRAYVDPQYITAEALLSATRTRETWADALHIK
eukprot:gene6135-4415_t